MILIILDLWELKGLHGRGGGLERLHGVALVLEVGGLVSAGPLGLDPV